MKKISAAHLMFVFFPFFLMAQIKVPDKAIVESFLKSKTYVVLEDNPFSAFNTFVGSGFSEVWIITPYEVITYEEFEKKM